MDPRRAWHWLAWLVFACAAAANAHAWFTADRMPPGDFPGYAAQVRQAQWPRGVEPDRVGQLRGQAQVREWDGPGGRQ